MLSAFYCVVFHESFYICSIGLSFQFSIPISPHDFQQPFGMIRMLFASLLWLGALSALVAGVPEPTQRNVATFNITHIFTVLDRVSTGMTKVDAEVKLWLGDLDNGLRILDDAKWVHQDMSTGATFLNGLPNDVMSTFDSMKIAGPMSKMMKLADSYTNGLVKNKVVIYKLALQSEFISSLQSSKLAAQQLSQAVKNKQPVTMAWSVDPTTEVFIRQFEKTARELSIPPSQYQSNPFN